MPPYPRELLDQIATYLPTITAISILNLPGWRDYRSDSLQQIQHKQNYFHSVNIASMGYCDCRFKCDSNDYCNVIVGFAAKRGHLKVIQWLFTNRSEYCSAGAMDWAANNGYLEIIKYICANGKATNCTTNWMNRAAQNGHLNVVEWLHYNRNEGCTTHAMDWAARNGHLQMVKWLSENRSEGCTRAAFLGAANRGHLDVAKWLLKNKYDSCCLQDAMVGAKECGRNEIVEWLQVVWLKFGPMKICSDSMPKRDYNSKCHGRFAEYIV